MIYPTTFETPDVTLTCGICGWSGNVAVSDMEHPANPNGESNPNYLVMICGNPECNCTCIHPIGGGVRPGPVQLLFIVHRMETQGMTFAQAKADVKTAAEDMDWPGKFILSESDSVTHAVQILASNHV